jgi:hypothetical protein
MSSATTTVDAYLASLPADRRSAVGKLRQVIVSNLPAGFQEVMTNMPSYVVPLSTFPDGYHCTADTPLPFLSFASLKNFVAVYHFGMYVDQELMQWFVEQYPKHVSSKLDMGKSCIRFKKPDQIPFELIGQLAARRTVDQWIDCYENALGRK